MSWWGIVMFIIIRVVMTLFMCFVPAISMIFDLLSVALFGANWIAFLVSLSSIMICSTIMYVLGRTGAYGVFEKILGKEDLDKANELLRKKGIVFYPFMMACGGFPDDAIVCMAGVIKMNVAYWIPATAIGRGIGCAFTIFGISLIPFDTFTRPYDWLVFIVCIIVLLYIVFKVGNWLSNKINLLLEKRKDNH